MTRLERITTATNCCSAGIRCYECPYKELKGNSIIFKECQAKFLRDFFDETGIADSCVWWREDDEA